MEILQINEYARVQPKKTFQKRKKIKQREPRSDKKKTSVTQGIKLFVRMYFMTERSICKYDSNLKKSQTAEEN